MATWAGPIRITRTRGAYFLRGRPCGCVCPSRIQSTFSSRGDRRSASRARDYARRTRCSLCANHDDLGNGPRPRLVDRSLDERVVGIARDASHSPSLSTNQTEPDRDPTSPAAEKEKARGGRRDPYGRHEPRREEEDHGCSDGARQERPGPHSPLPPTASAGGRLTISCGRRPAPHRLDRVSPRETESAPWGARIADFNLENRGERKYSSLRKKLLSRLKGPSVGPESMKGERGGGVAETLVSTPLVLAAIPTACVPFAGPSRHSVGGPP